MFVGNRGISNPDVRLIGLKRNVAARRLAVARRRLPKLYSFPVAEKSFNLVAKLPPVEIAGNGKDRFIRPIMSLMKLVDIVDSCRSQPPFVSEARPAPGIRILLPPQLDH